MENATGKWENGLNMCEIERKREPAESNERDKERERGTGKFFVWLPRDSFKKICQPFSTDKSGQHVIAE